MRRTLLAVLWIISAGLLSGRDAAPAAEKESYSPEWPETKLFWGDTHLHTRRSVDAYNFGNRRLSVEDAYAFARGQKVKAHNGMIAQLRRPMDFLVIADHAENMNMMAMVAENNLALAALPEGRTLRKEWLEVLASAGSGEEASTKFRFFLNLLSGRNVGGEKLKRSVWEQTLAAADENNDPGKFTAFIGYEWSSSGRTPGGNLHRVVIFRDSATTVGKTLPFSSLDSSDPEDLWRYLRNYEQHTGGEVFAIPHNGNVSNGEMFGLTDFTGRPLDAGYARSRSRWEPLYEVTQIKGDGEAHPLLSPADEFADYETWNSWAGRAYGNLPATSRKQRKEAEYARSALKLGLGQFEELGVNPFKFGMIGSTDAHTSLTTPEEDNFWGKMTASEPGPSRVTASWVPGAPGTVGDMAWQLTASGYAAVWAEENTRASLFAAMKRKEVYATTGSRIMVRFFGGWNFEQDDAFSPDLANIGYRRGVPMGGDLTRPGEDIAPRFLLRAVKDPVGANLDRIQIIKGWRGKDGELHEKIYNVVLSDGRRIDRDGKAPPVGSTVNVQQATYRNTIGDPELAVVWQDPDFNPDEVAFYYARVIEIPTPRWTAYDARFFQTKDLVSEIEMTTQERAYTSPVWYTP